MAERVTVVGAGLGGSLMAALLGSEGWDVELVERRLDPRQTHAEEGRSINLALSERGIHALGQVGLADRVLDQAVRLHGRLIHSVDGRFAYQAYGRGGQGINSVSRTDLNRVLLDAAEQQPSVRIRFGLRCEDVDLEHAAVELEDVRGGGGSSGSTASTTIRPSWSTVTRSSPSHRRRAAAGAWSRTSCTSGPGAGS